MSHRECHFGSASPFPRRTALKFLIAVNAAFNGVRRFTSDDVDAAPSRVPIL
jgi:hypothetical protein